MITHLVDNIFSVQILSHPNICCPMQNMCLNSNTRNLLLIVYRMVDLCLGFSSLNLVGMNHIGNI